MLAEIQKESGAIFSEDHPSIPLHFGHPENEYQTACTQAVVIDLSHRSQMEFLGTDRLSFLNGLCTNAVKALKPGNGCEAFACSIQGKVLGHLFISALEQSLWIDSTPQSAETLLSHFNHYLITEDVQLHDRTPETGTILLAGPTAETLLEPFLSKAGNELALSDAMQHQIVEQKAYPLRIARLNWFKQPAFQLFGLRDQLASVWTDLQSCGFQPAGSSTFEALRITAGFPLYGKDFSSVNLAQEVNRNQDAISFTKGCYLGQETVARIDSRGHVNRLLVSLVCETESPLPEYLPLRSDSQEEKVGTITSTCHVSSEQCSYAIAIVRREIVTDKHNQKLFVVVKGKELPVEFQEA